MTPRSHGHHGPWVICTMSGHNLGLPEPHLGMERIRVSNPTIPFLQPAADCPGTDNSEFIGILAQLGAQFSQLAITFAGQIGPFLHMIVIFLVGLIMYFLGMMNGGIKTTESGPPVSSNSRSVRQSGNWGPAHLAWLFFVSAACCNMRPGEIRHSIRVHNPCFVSAPSTPPEREDASSSLHRSVAESGT